MAVVQGIKERVHLPIYDCIRVEPEKQIRDVESSSTFKFFINVQGKTKLETNLQSAGLLPHYNTFEARAMRVVISDLPPEFPDEPNASQTEDDAFEFTGRDTSTTPASDKALFITPTTTNPPVVNYAGAQGVNDVLLLADVELPLKEVMKLLAEAREGEGEVELDVSDDSVIKFRRKGGALVNAAERGLILAKRPEVVLTTSDLEGLLEDGLEDDKKAPPRFQLRPDNGAGNFLGNFVYSTVTTFYVGEKIMIQMPTWFYPGGAGVWTQAGKGLTHGEPNPTATFRFAEPIFIDKQQNFRVEIEIPDADTLKELQRTYGPLNIWVVLDGYMTRNVQ